MSMAEQYGYNLADRNKRVADRNAEVANHNAKAVDSWMAYANKLKTKLEAVAQERHTMRGAIDDLSRERDALRLQLDNIRNERNVTAAQLESEKDRVAVLAALQDHLATELGKVSPEHPLVPLVRRTEIIEAAVKMAKQPMTSPSQLHKPLAMG
jgi:hypothetical protein